jgi:hypothetical protein
MIKFTLYEWREIKERLATDYGRSVLLLKEKTKRELGFTVRLHHDFEFPSVVCLDFYDDAKETMFRLKYL